MEPARSIIALFRTSDFTGPEIVSGITGTRLTAPYRWMQSVQKGGTGGLIPQRHHATLIDAARERGLPLRYEHFAADQTPDFSEAEAVS